MQTTTAKTLLEQAFDPESFRELGHELIDLLADNLKRVEQSADAKVINYTEPADELAYWEQDARQLGTREPMAFFKDILQHAIHIHHPGYIGHQVSAPALVASLAGLVSDVLNNGTGVYEMGMAANALERVVTNFTAKKFGFPDDAAGFLTSGGTLANFTAMLAARKAKAPTEVWEHGHQEKLAIMVSAEAHYCIDRAARILGMGSAGIIKVPVNDQFQIDVAQLERCYQEATRAGLKVIAMVGSACSTATGSYDDLAALADFSEKHNLWFHVDGAHGAAVVFSDKHKQLVTGIERADSVIIDYHKMLMTPALATGVIFRREADSYKTFAQKAQYLWDAQQAPEWFNTGRRTFECTKTMMVIKFYAILKTYGESIFTEHIERLFALTRHFVKMIRERPAFELATEPQANIVNFRYIGHSSENANELNSFIRQRLLESGKFYIVQTMLGNKRYLRTSIMNPLTTEAHLQALLDEIAMLAKHF